MSRARVRERHKRFSGTREEVEDNELPGRTVTARTESKIDYIELRFDG